MGSLDMRDRITLGAGALLLAGVVLVVIALLTSALSPAIAGVAAGAAGYGVLTGQRRGSARRR
jgi:hypothetical protein